MIAVQDLFNSLVEYVPDYGAGANPMPEFNDKVNEAQKELMDLLAPQYDKNERIRTLLDPFVNKVTGSAAGSIPKPAGYYRALGITVTSAGTSIPLYQAKENELIEFDFIPQRKADFSRGIGYYKQAGANITVIPGDSVSYTMYYLKSPAQANLDFTYTVVPSTETALVPSGAIDLEWNPDAYDILLNCLLKKYGVLTREQFITYVASLDIQQDLVSQP